MAVVYFANNASTGAGSLVAAILSAAAGDVIQPDETVFERGLIIEIALSSALTIDKTLTFNGGPYRVRLNGGGSTACANITDGATVEFVGFDFVGSSGAAVATTGDVTFDRCRIAGANGDGVASDGNAVTLKNSVVCGNNGAPVVAGSAVIDGSTVVGNVDALEVVDVAVNNSIVPGSPSVVPSQIGFVVAPPDDFSADAWTADAWKSWDLRLLDDASSSPSPYRDSGDVGAILRYDLDGNFRGRETNGVATCSPGAYETIQADLFWIGRDATGAEVVSPSFLTSDGWAASRFATVAGDVAPQAGQTLFIDGDVTFGDVLPTFSGGLASVVVGGLAQVVFDKGSVGLRTLRVGLGALLTASISVSSAASKVIVGAWTRIRSITSSARCEFDVNSYVANARLYNDFISPVPTYGKLTVAPSGLGRVRFDGVYICDSFETNYEGTSPARTFKIGDTATIRAKTVNFRAIANAPFETLFDKRVTVELQGGAELTVGAAAPASWADAFAIDVTEATSATLTLNGQTIYGDAPTCAVALTGTARIDGADSLTVASLTFTEGATVEFANDANVILTTASATSATAIGRGAFFAPIAAPVGLTLENGAVWGDASAGVTSLDVTPVNATTATFAVVKTNADANIVAQYSDDDGATWQAVATTADADEYELTVAQGADVTVRVATATGWLTDTVSTALFLPVWTVAAPSESVIGVVNAFEISTGGSNTGNNSYNLSGWGTL